MLWAKPGQVKKLEGLEELKKIRGIFVILQRFQIGDIIPEQISMRQIAFYILIVAENANKMRELISTINKTLHVYNELGEELLIPFENINII